MEELLKKMSSLRKDFIEEFEEDNEGTPWADTWDWEDDPSFYRGLDRGVELAMAIVYEVFGKETNDSK
jgi:hypothetical protein